MESYSPLQMHDLEHQPEDSEEDVTLLPSKRFISEPNSTDPQSKWSTWATQGLSILAVAGACALYITSANIPGSRDAHGLRQPNQNPGLEFVMELQQKVYSSGSHVILSDDVSGYPRPEVTWTFISFQDSMFFQWHLPPSRFRSCYIDSVVPTPEDGLAANKTYTSSGSLTQIQIWNVTTPTEPMRSLSWNSRPQRIALMGAVAFLPEKDKVEQLHVEDGWQSLMPTRFSCGEKATVSIEVACEGCKLEFEQLFSNPPLAFDLMEIG